MACFSASVVRESPVAGFICGFCGGCLTEFAAIERVGSSYSPLSSSTCANCLGVAGAVGVPLNLGDLLAGCLAGVPEDVFSNGVPVLFLGDDLVATLGPFFPTGIFGPNPDFGGGFDFFSFPPCFFLSLASAAFLLFSAAGDNLSGSFPFFSLPILQRFDPIFA